MAAEAQLGITRADQYPSATAGVAALGQRNSAAVGSVRTIAGVEVSATSLADKADPYESHTCGKHTRINEPTETPENLTIAPGHERHFAIDLGRALPLSGHKCPTD